MPMFFKKSKCFVFFETLYLFILFLQSIGLLLPFRKRENAEFLD